MRFLGKMIVKLLVNNQFIDVEDKNSVQQEFDESFQKISDSTNPFVKKINVLIMSPIGVLSALWFFIYTSRYVRRESQASQAESLKDQFKNDIQIEVMKDLMTQFKS